MMTAGEFVDYLVTVEAANSGKGWRQIITKMHQHWYAHDATIVILGIPLFIDGKENAGWKGVTLPVSPPKHIVVKGECINIAHAYAGMRAGLNRNAVASVFMKRVNTGWGDAVQVMSGWITGVCNSVKGSAQWYVDKSEGNQTIWEAHETIASAHQYMPPAQRVGNRIGLQLAALLESGHYKTLSEAFSNAILEMG